MKSPLDACYKRALVTCLVLTLTLAASAQGEVRVLREPIVNGLLDWNLPSVVALLGPEGGFCTGTLIGCQTVLTAAHCFCGDQLSGAACSQRADLLDPSKVIIFAQHAGFFGVSSVVVNPTYQFTGQSDLAIVRLATPVTGIANSPLNLNGRIPKGSQGVIAGFGRAGGNAVDFGLKRAGLVTTSTCTVVPDSSHVCWNFSNPLGSPGFNSSTCQGDSGGPLFVVAGGALHLAGVTSGGVSNSCLPPAQGFQADSFVNAAWIQAQAGADLGTTACGGLAPAGSTSAPVLAGAGILSPSNTEDRFVFSLPPGTQRVRVALNGDETTAGADFDLYVNSSTPPTPNDTLCGSEFQGPWEYCEIPSPAAGEWHVLVNRFSGFGAYQLTITPHLANSVSQGCTPSATNLCLSSGRFRVEAVWQTGDGTTGFAQAVPLTADTGYFWFFNSANVEMVVKVLNACGLGRYWVFAGGLTNVQVVLKVTDTQTGETRTYVNPQGTSFQPIQDTNAFATCP